MKKTDIIVDKHRFTHALRDLISSGIASDFRSRIPVMTYLHFVNKDKEHYDFVAVDEVQDVPASILNAIRKRTKKLLVAGDDAQNIYESGSGAEEIESILKPERVSLPVVYRLTRKIINVVRNLLPDNHMVTVTAERMEETQVTLARANSRELELTWVWHQAQSFAETGYPSVVVLPNHSIIQSFMDFVARIEGRAALKFRNNSFGNTDYAVANESLLTADSGICLQYLGNGYGSLEDSDSRPIVYVMTYHSIKGLEFRTVFLPLLTEQTVFWNDPEIDRRLFFVGATRSRRDLFLSYHGKKPHPYVQCMPQEELHKIEIDHSVDNDKDEFIF